MKTSGGPILTSGLNSTNEWGLLIQGGSNIRIATNSAPLVIAYPVTASYMDGSKYDDTNTINITTDGSSPNGWGISHAYVPNGTNSVLLNAPYNAVVCHGSKQFYYMPGSLTADHDGYMFFITDVTANYVTITKNGITQDVVETIISASSGWGMSYAAVPVETGDQVVFTDPYPNAVIY